MVKLKPENGGDEINVELNDRKDGTYLAEYTVDKMCGKLTLSVCLQGEHIKGSPFAVNVELSRIKVEKQRSPWREAAEAVRRNYQF